nr:MAG TPA: hypothetical protein [Caudoviricetes sp.]
MSNNVFLVKNHSKNSILSFFYLSFLFVNVCLCCRF